MNDFPGLLRSLSLEGALQTEILSIRQAAYGLHRRVCQTYGGIHPYGFHLDMVASETLRYLPEILQKAGDLLPVLFGAFFHDSIEDARCTYGEVLDLAGGHMPPGDALTAAEIVYALTLGKGRTRREQAGEDYYQGIRSVPYAPLVKLADRMANFSYALAHGQDGMAARYRAEMPEVLEALTRGSLDPSGDSRFRVPVRMVLKAREMADAPAACVPEDRFLEFDRQVDRHGTDSVKWDGLLEQFGREDLRAMWVADMDFATPEFILERLHERLCHPVLGYGLTPQGWRRASSDWIRRRHGVAIPEEDLLFIPGIVRGIAFAIQALTREGDRILVMEPVYHPFFLVPQRNGRQVVFSSLEIRDGRMEVNWERLECDLKGCRMMILSNPHNPGGRVWRCGELERMADLAQKHGVLVLSDEIHADLNLFGLPHHSYSTVSKAARAHSITMMAPSKTFNMPGLCSSMAIIPDPVIRQKLESYMEASELGMGNILAFEATQAAFSAEGEEWLGRLLAYLEMNLSTLERFLAERIPGVGMIRPEASFLVFLDFRALGLSQEALVSLVRDRARLALNDGAMFGPSGRGFMRMNIALPRRQLLEALEALAGAVRGLQDT